MWLLGFIGMGPTEMIIVGVIAVLLFGSRLPEVARSLGKSFVEFKRGIQGMESELNEAIYHTPSSSSAPSDSSSSYDSSSYDDAMQDRLEPDAPKFEPPADEPSAGDEAAHCPGGTDRSPRRGVAEVDRGGGGEADPG